MLMANRLASQWTSEPAGEYGLVAGDDGAQHDAERLNVVGRAAESEPEFPEVGTGTRKARGLRPKALRSG
jgi:hypothetical protein